MTTNAANRRERTISLGVGLRHHSFIFRLFVLLQKPPGNHSVSRQSEPSHCLVFSQSESRVPHPSRGCEVAAPLRDSLAFTTARLLVNIALSANGALPSARFRPITRAHRSKNAMASCPRQHCKRAPQPAVRSKLPPQSSTDVWLACNLAHFPIHRLQAASTNTLRQERRPTD